MNYFWEIITITFYFSLFAFFHSLTAAVNLKKKVAEKFPDFIPFYRLFYNFISLITFYFFWTLSPKPRLVIIDHRFPYDIIFFVFQVASLFGLIYTFSFVDFKEFLGIAQIKRFFSRTYKEELDEHPQLLKSGPFSFTRHPVYLFSILILVFQPFIDLFFLVFILLTLIYFYIGTFLEEKRLIMYFGEEYLEYTKKVSRLFPLKAIFRMFSK